MSPTQAATLRPAASAGLVATLSSLLGQRLLRQCRFPQAALAKAGRIQYTDEAICLLLDGFVIRGFCLVSRGQRYNRWVWLLTKLTKNLAICLMDGFVIRGFCLVSRGQRYNRWVWLLTKKSSDMPFGWICHSWFLPGVRSRV